MARRVSKPRAGRSRLHLSRACHDEAVLASSVSLTTRPIHLETESLYGRRDQPVSTEGRPVSRRSERLQARRQPLVETSDSRSATAAPRFTARSPLHGVSSLALPVRVSLTENNLRRFDAMTRPRRPPGDEWHPASAMAAPPVRDDARTAGSRQSDPATPSTSRFGHQAKNNGVLDRVHSQPPANLDSLREQLNRTRQTASPTVSQYEAYVYAVETAPNEATIVHETTRLLKEYDDRGYRKVFSQAFTAFPGDVGFNDGMPAPQPDMVEGLQLDEFHPFPARDVLGGAAVLFRDRPYSITLPHLAAEWKGPGKDMLQARTQSAYNGAALVYGRNQALAFLRARDPAGQATVCTFSTDGTNINFNAHFAAPRSGRPLSGGQTTEYHQYPIVSTNLTNSFSEFKRGRRQLRNLQDGARKASYALRDRLRQHGVASAESGDGFETEPVATSSTSKYGRGRRRGRSVADGRSQRTSDRSTRRGRSRRKHQ
ncbi:hypothetical protein CMQ_6709 [Grosmannia clavigera kw1407]|uniref:DUF7924 domain-containing protein n=1 Tax=Grosmannia clavigera (strain kw1407 / UAMH 11150) TaxID=655863 RepID=F0X7F0_GROCL|nr:uncharacterized protein CMQ_6709 [Grosmannia clavigera kw1407]EFX06388.1 hypothetical protein CMQ_6709 [Grosmannia clavigera kw1407]